VQTFGRPCPQLESGYDIRTIQELLGHRDVSTAICQPKRSARRLMIYTHVLNQGGRGVRSPLDSMAGVADRQP
jgi:hypothetical protein